MQAIKETNIIKLNFNLKLFVLKKNNLYFLASIKYYKQKLFI